MEQTQAIILHFQDSVDACVLDMKGQDENFYHTAQLAKIYWWAGRINTLEYYLSSAEIRTHTEQFMEAVAKEYGIHLRRLQDARQRYLKIYKKGDSLKETVERAFHEHGGWSKILPPKQSEVEPVECEHDYLCSKCGKHK